MDLSKTFMGEESVCFGGHSYRKAYEKTDGTVVWRCRTKLDRKSCCSGRGVKNGNANFNVTVPHDITCVPDDVEVEVKKRKVDMKDAVDAAPLQPTMAIYNAALVSASDQVKARMPVLEKQKRGILGWKSKLIPGAPVDLANFVLPPVYSHTITGNRPLYHYVGAGQEIVIIGTDRDLLRLAAADFWLGDGFHSIPLYEQIYVFGTKDDGIFLPAIYALTRQKNTQTYITVIQELKAWALQLGVVLNPDRVRTDFEAQISGCQFHHADAIWMWVNRNGLSVLYRTNIEFKEMVHKLMVACFLPEADIVAGVDRLEQICPPAIAVSFGQVLTYYRNYWIAQWGPAAICHYDDYCRTNNDVESFNRTMRRQIGHNTGNVNKIIDLCRKEEDKMNTKLIQLGVHPGQFIVRRNKMSAAINREIGVCFTDYGLGNMTMDRFLSRVAHLANPTFFNVP